MANDIVLTEEEQAERVKAWWKENGTSVITGALIGIAAIAGYNYWQTEKNAGLEQASEQYSLLLGAMTTPDSAAARELSEAIIDQHSGSVYASKAALIQAKLLADSGDLSAALESLMLAKSSATEPGLVHVANLRIIRIFLEQGEIELAKAAIEAVTDRTGFEAEYFELDGDVAHAQGDLESAREKYTSANESPNADPGYANVLQLKIDALGAGTTSVVADVRFEGSAIQVEEIETETAVETNAVETNIEATEQAVDSVEDDAANADAIQE